MTDKPFTLNEQQLELLCDAKTYILLETFKEPLNPSAAAKKLGMPANRVHYHVKRLATARLLRTVSENGRSRVYETVATKFHFRKELLGQVATSLTAGAEDLLTGLQREFVNSFEHFFQAAQGEADGDSSHYGLLELGDGVPLRAYQPLLGTAGVRLSREGYAQVVQAIMAALHDAELKESQSGETCTVAVVVYPGRAVPT